MKNIMLLAKTDIKRSFKTPKLWLILIFTFMFFYDFALQSVIPYAKGLNVGVTPYTFPLFYSDWSGILYGVMLMAALMSDAPFRNGSELYIRLRTDGYKWLTGKLVYMIIISFIYHALSVIISVIVCMPYVGLSLNWGSAIEGYIDISSDSLTTYGVQSEAALLSYKPLTAMTYQFFIAVLINIMLGLVIFTINGILKNYTGTVLVCIFSCIHIFLNEFEFYGTFDNISNKIPMSWLNLSEYSNKMTPFTAIIILLIISIIIFALDIILVKAKKLNGDML